MRVLFVNHTFPPESCAGSELCVLQLAHELVRKGHEAAVFYRIHNPDLDEYQIVPGEYQGLPVFKINNTFRFLHTFQDIYLSPVLGAKFSHLLHEWKPDLVHFHHLTNLSLSLVPEAKAYGCPVVMTLHDYWLLCQRGQLLKRDLQLCPGPGEAACRACLSMQLLRGGSQRWVSRLQRLAGRLHTAKPAGVDLLDLRRASPRTPNRDFVGRSSFQLGEPPDTVLLAHPPAEIEYPLNLPRGGLLQTAAALHPSTYTQPGQGVRFEVTRNGEILEQVELNPKQNPADGGWRPITVPLPPSSDPNDSLILKTSAQAGEDNRFCTAGWRQPRIRVEGAPTLEERTASRSIARRALYKAAEKAAELYTALSPTAREGIAHRRNWVRRVFDQTDLFISPSEFLRDFFVRHGLPPEKIRYSDNGFPAPPPMQPRDVSFPIRFGYIGTWIPSKGVDLLLRAFRDIDPKQARLEVHGFFPGYDGYEDYETELRSLAGPAVEFKGRYEPKEVYSLLERMDCLIMPSIWWENSPMTLHEAFLARVPVLTADAGGMAEQVQRGGGLTFEHRNWRSLRERILQLIDNPERVNRLRAAIPGVKSVEEHAEEMLRLYEEMLGQTKGKREGSS